jgi:hypothetical protein
MDVLHAIRSNATEVMDAGAQPHAAYASFTCAALSWIVFLGVLHKVVASALHDRSCSWLKDFDAIYLREGRIYQVKPLIGTILRDSLTWLQSCLSAVCSAAIGEREREGEEGACWQAGSWD